MTTEKFKLKEENAGTGSNEVNTERELEKSSPENKEGDFEWLLQKWPAFNDEAFEEENIDLNGKRKPATPEQKEKMDNDFEKLGKLLEGSDISWFLGGAANISFAEGEYIGFHKDIDLSVEDGDLEKLEKHLKSKGYGLFIREGDIVGETTWRRVGAKKVNGDTVICRIDERGAIDKEDSLSFVDLYPIRRNKQGEAIGHFDIILPEKWFEPKIIDFKETKLNLSPPARLAYFKLHCERTYDMDDLEKMVKNNSLSVKDI
ncbi:MAG: hypothetical protein Q8N55_01305, partial [bacterium]|nr:hypothetical protein [bacterium]